jgi:excinuclease ABC subunit B
MYADEITRSMDKAITETARRREIQQNYNTEHNITPKTIVKEIRGVIEITSKETIEHRLDGKKLSKSERLKLIDDLTKQMKEAAKLLEFEHAAFLRDKIRELSE